jgi:hypothetical protein
MVKRAWSPMIPCAENYENCMVTSCPFGANAPKAVIILKTKGKERRFSRAKAVRVLITSRLRESMEIGKVRDKLSSDMQDRESTGQFSLWLFMAYKRGLTIARRENSPGLSDPRA